MKIVKYFFEIHESALDSAEVTVCKVQISTILLLKIGTLGRIEYILRDIFNVLTYLGSHHEYKVNKYIQMFYKVYGFLARALSLLPDHVS